MSLKALSDYTFYSRYSHYLPEKRRRETWEEAVKRVFNMHREKYSKEISKSEELKKEIDFAEKQQLKKRVIGAQRNLQFGGDFIFKHQMKSYNCSYTLCDRPRVFQEINYALLCGTGVGASVQKKHIKQLPKISNRKKGIKKFIVPDSIEGWSDAFGILFNSYVDEKYSIFPEYSGYKIEFDFSKIRPKGALIAGQFKAPGHNGLKQSLERCEKLIDERLKSESFQKDEFSNKLKPIDAYDFIAHMSDSVLSGGIRRSALIILFSLDDQEMMESKTNSWFIENPQRARSNNSVVLERGKTKKEDFSKIFNSIKHSGEPGFYFIEDGEFDIGANPCQPEWAKFLTPNGIRNLSDINIGDKIWSKDGWTTVKKKWSNGVKKVFEYRTTGGVFYGTNSHKLVSKGEKIKAEDCETIDIISGEYSSNVVIDPKIVMDGIVFGDGSVHKASNNLVFLCIGANDYDYFNSEVSNFIKKERAGLSDYAYEIETNILSEELLRTYDRVIPDRYYYGNKDTVSSFLRGIYTANGSICGERVTLKSASFKLISQVQEMLSFLGIRSYYTTNKSKKVKFANGEYLCKESYDLNIGRDKEKFYNIIGFIQNYKLEKLEKIIKNSKNNRLCSHEIKEINFISEEEVFDITVDNESHTYWTSCCDVSNCVEIGLYPKTEDGRSGFETCNLSEINGKYCKDKESFLQACRAASIIGTLQAGYTDFKYFSKETKEIIEREALLGVSITGLMDNPEILFNEEIQKDGAKEVVETNKKIAKLIGINPSARTTCVKPSGSASAMLGTASGIHPQHAKRYIRRVQSNNEEFILKKFAEINPLAVEKSYWSATGSDSSVSFLCEVPAGGITKNQISAIDFLEKVKSTQKNWVLNGTVRENCVNKNVNHNVSVTCIVKDDEWKEVESFIWENRKYFTGVSLLSASGDLDYVQAPFSTVLTPKEMVQEYGDASVFASGLVVDALKCFDNNLWAACDSALGIGEKVPSDEELTKKEPKYPSSRNYKDLSKYFEQRDKYEILLQKRDWIRRIEQFSDRYFEGNLKKTIYCLKHVSLWKRWCDLKREYKDIDWSNIIEDKQEYQNADEQAAIACSGGKCEIT